MERAVFWYANGVKIYQFKANNSEIKSNGYLCDFSIDYNTIDVSDIVDFTKI